MSRESTDGRESGDGQGADALADRASLKAAMRDAGYDPERLQPAELDQLRDILRRATGANDATTAARDADSSRASKNASDPAETTGTAAADSETTDADTTGTGTTDGEAADGEAAGEGSRRAARRNGSTTAVGATEPGDVPRLARVGMDAARELTLRSVRTYTRTSTRFLQAAANAESAVDLLDESQDIVRDEAARLGLDDGRGRERQSERRERAADTHDSDPESLLERGRRLLEQSADVTQTESTHPAYSRILDELAQDEARVLRLLAREGAQPVVDVYDRGWLPLGSELVAGRCSMIGSEAGCRADANLSAYLNNLQRLGLVAIADEPVDDLTRYQVLEAQPEVEEAMDAATRGVTKRRKAHLTPFGVDFCRTCLPVSVEATEAADTGQPEAGPNG